MDVGMEDGMNDSKEIFAKLKPMVEAKVAGCEDCDVCAKWREMLEVVDKGKPYCDKPSLTRHCGFGAVQCINCESYFKGNHDLTTAMHGSKLLLVWILEEMGLWKHCYNHIFHEIEMRLFSEGEVSPLMIKILALDEIIATVVDGAKLVPAVNSYLETELLERLCKEGK